jgi:Flp pilus assembly pilin Flp
LSSNPLTRFARDETGAAAFEAIWVALFLVFFITPTTFLYQFAKTGLTVSWEQRSNARNEAMNDNCNGIALLPIGVSASTGVNSVTGYTCTTGEGEIESGSGGQTTLGSFNLKKFWKAQDEVTNAHFQDFTEDMRDKGKVQMIKGSSATQYTDTFDVGKASLAQGLILIPKTSSIVSPDGDYWTFDDTHWKEGHDKRIWREFTHQKHKEMFPNVFPSAN